jgi:hypothetical protein
MRGGIEKQHVYNKRELPESTKTSSGNDDRHAVARALVHLGKPEEEEGMRKARFVWRSKCGEPHCEKNKTMTNN